jgi:hypothetical protein
MKIEKKEEKVLMEAILQYTVLGILLIKTIVASIQAKVS